MAWTTVCAKEDLVENSGICALVAGQQVAIFLLLIEGQQRLYAVGNYDPIGGANVMSRGIPGSVGEQLVVASPLYKQQFDLATGQCLQQPEYRLPCYAIGLEQGMVSVFSEPLRIEERASAA